MSSTAYDICNRALARVGGNRVTTFEDGSAESDVAGREYEALVRGKLGGAFEWRFAMELAALGVPLTDTPADKWLYGYNLPADLLVIRAVRRGDQPISFDRYGAKLFCDDDADVVIEYTFRQVEASWPPYFEEAVVASLASMFAVALNRDIDLSNRFARDAAQLWTEARFADSKGRTTERVIAGRIRGVRR